MGRSACRSGVGDEAETSLGRESRVWLHQADKVGPTRRGHDQERKGKTEPTGGWPDRTLGTLAAQKRSRGHFPSSAPAAH